MFFAPTPVNLVPYDMSSDYVLLEPLTFDGKQVYRDLYGEVTRGTFAITSAAQDPGSVGWWMCSTPRKAPLKHSREPRVWIMSLTRTATGTGRAAWSHDRLHAQRAERL